MNKRFPSFGLRPEFISVLEDMRITEPTPIQAQAIPRLLQGQDLVGQARTGTGKTLAYALPMLHRTRVQFDDVQGLILTPTRELALQITEVMNKLAAPIGANVAAVYGGQDIERQIRKLQGAVHVIIATPGRLLELLDKKAVHLGKLSMLILDEADQMLHMGFFPDVEQIIKQAASRKQVALFSATLPQPVRNLAKRFMKSPQIVQIDHRTIFPLDDIRLVAIRANEEQKQNVLSKLIGEHQPYLGLVFCKTKQKTEAVADSLAQAGYVVEELHGDLPAAKRQQVMRRFREAKLQILVATDLAARGLDVEGITHIYNYDLPQDANSFVHRIGRTARAGQEGTAVTLVTPDEILQFGEIEKALGVKQETYDASGQSVAFAAAAKVAKPAARTVRHATRSTAAKSSPAVRGKRSRSTGAGRDQQGGRPSRRGRGRSR